ncbi:MAG: hypothetical protein NT039_01305, partial [Candidatus Berkelbacteria bacterium]|nr:hypothetical protein [Candidatus Berkelbacteria bacterium]
MAEIDNVKLNNNYKNKYLPMRLKKKTKTQITNQVKYYVRAGRRFERVIIKNRNQEKIRWIRENLLAVTKLFDLKEKNHREEFIDFFRETLKIIKSDKKLLLYRYLTKVLEQMDLEESYFFTLLIYLYTNYICFWENNLITINSRKMRVLKRKTTEKKRNGIKQRIKKLIIKNQLNKKTLSIEIGLSPFLSQE